VPNPVSNLYRITPDNIQEYKVTTNNATAEEGRNSGASISIATRAGTSEFHGTGFFFLRNEALNSNEWYQNAQKNPKPLIRMNQFGYEMSGPIKKNKTFFFGSCLLRAKRTPPGRTFRRLTSTRVSEPYINTPRTARWVTTPQILDNLSIVRGAHVFRTGLNFRFYRHVDQRGQPGGINVTPPVTFSQTTRPSFVGTTGNSGFTTAPNINSTDATTLGSLINNLYGLRPR
jgi:hypothetical protein